MQFLEKQLEDIIYEHLQTRSGREKLNDRGLDVFADRFFWIKRQVKIGGYGIADIITASICDKTLQVTIYELKQKNVCEKTLIQSARYRTGVVRYLEQRWKGKVDVSVVLVGSKIVDTDWVYLIDMVDGLSVYGYKYDIDGLTFHAMFGFHLIDEDIW